MSDLFSLSHNPLLFAAPFFLLTILVELAALRFLDHDDTTVYRGYKGADTRASLLMGVGSLVTSTIVKLSSFVLYVALFVWVAPFHLDVHAWWYWPALLLLLDLLFYANHRFVHRVNIGWAAHQAHHSSEYMNFGTALRQKWNPWFEIIFWLPVPLLGFTPWTIYVAFSFNLIFQFLVHTELVDKLWAPIEFVMNTPSHHRVHHGSDQEYLDCNYAGMFIIWDRMFGSFVAEKQRPTYGLTKPVDTYNPIKLQYGDYAALWRNVRGADSFRDRLGYLFGPPGWEPASPRLVEQRGTSVVETR